MSIFFMNDDMLERAIREVLDVVTDLGRFTLDPETASLIASESFLRIAGKKARKPVKTGAPKVAYTYLLITPDMENAEPIPAKLAESIAREAGVDFAKAKRGVAALAGNAPYYAIPLIVDWNGDGADMARTILIEREVKSCADGTSLNPEPQEPEHD
jgi:hypothetical protein